MRRLIALAALIQLGACQTAPEVKPSTGLSETDTEAYLVLMDQLAEVSRASSAPAAVYCVAVYTLDDPEGMHTNPALIEKITRDALESFDVHLVPGRKCSATTFGDTPSPPRRPDVFAAMKLGESSPGTWLAGYVCGALCGHGNRYIIEYRSGTLVAKRVGYFIS